MALKEVKLGGNFEDKPVEYIKYSNLEPNTIIADGTYEGSFTGGQYNSTTYYVDCGAVKVGLPSAGQLDSLISAANLSRGDRIQIIYNGKEEMQSGERKGQLAHSFKLLVDDGNDAE